MRYYIDNLNIHNTNIINDYLSKQKKEKILLAQDGLYKYIDSQLYKFKIRSNNNDIIIQNNNNNIIASDISWKKFDISNQIPYIIKTIDMDIFDYNIVPDVTFRVEKNNNKISDFYFLSKYTYDNFFLKENIISFLSLINNIKNI